MKNIRVSHIYGQTAIQSRFCKDCNQRAFIVRGEFTCCGRPAAKRYSHEAKIEVDSIGFKRRRPPLWLRQLVLEEQKNKCVYCGDEFGSMETTGNGGVYIVKIHWDHVVPFSYNGNNYDFVASCPTCNMRKGRRVFNSAKEAKAFLKEKYG